jgi:hypothetical protein
MTNKISILITRSIIAPILLAGLTSQVVAQYPGWPHDGSLYILTTPDGADLPATASVEGFPLLVRLSKEVFDFSQTQPNGADIRFSAGGKPLAYQIEEWDAAKGTASIWVRIPLIKGNARQEIKLHWGKADAAGESSGSAVFNESNGFLTVMHLSDPVNPVKDEVGSLTPTDAGTSASPGMIGQGRHFDIGKGIKGGETITTLPTGDSPHTSEAWFRAEQSNVDILGWGNQEWQGKVVMQLVSPAHMNMDCFFADCNVVGGSRIPMSQWIHVVNTYKRGESLIYVNGVLDGSNASGGAKGGRNNRGAPLAVKSPARMYVGGWYGNYRFVGDIDEVRLSKVVRSADWIKMEYESQDPRQTMVGILVQPGSAFSVSPASVTVDEGQSATVTAQAGGAQKTYWILKRDGAESVVAVDQASYTVDAGRVVGDTSLVLQFKAVCANEVKTRDVPVTIKEAIPEPVVTLKTPSKWNGRDTIEVLSVIGNLKAMKDKGAGELRYKWIVSGGAVTKEIAPDKLILKRSQYTGPITVTLAVDNGGATTVATAGLQVTQPKKDAWVERTPAQDEKPEDGQFYARDDQNEGTLYYNGTLSNPADSVFLKVYADDKLVKTETVKPTADKAYAFTVKLKPGLVKYKVEFGTKTGGAETVAQTVTNLVCGDAYLIDGQSNALATDTGEKAPPDTSEWIRSYGPPGGEESGPRQNLWCYPVWKAEKGEKAELGWWGMELAKRLLASQKVPIFIINGAVGGTRIDQHQRNESHPTDLSAIYGRMLWRVQQARLTHGIRALLWHQGESDQGSDGPTGGYGWESYQQYFLDMSAAWKQDFPNLRHYYLYQIWPNSCSMGNGHGDMLREVQRNLPRLYSNMDIMSTLGIQPPGGCHYPLIGWTEFARLIQPLIERDFYGKATATPITAPNLKQAYYTSSAKDAIALEFDQPVAWTDSLASQFYLDGVADKVAAGAVSGNVVTLKLKEVSAAKKVAYLKEMNWSQDKLLVGANGIAALTFCDVAIFTGRK